MKKLSEIAWNVPESVYREDPALSYSTLSRFDREGFANIDKLFDNIGELLNVTDILLNNEDADIIYTDEGLIGYQYLPKLGEVTVNYE